MPAMFAVRLINHSVNPGKARGVRLKLSGRIVASEQQPDGLA